LRAIRLVDAHLLQLVEIPDPEAVPGEVVVRVDGCGICGSDLTSYKVGLFTGTVPGHELAGVVQSVGAGVTGWSPGDEVVIDPKIPCGACDDCRSGAGHRCAMALTAGIGFARDGGFAELVAAAAGLPPGASHRRHIQFPGQLASRSFLRNRYCTYGNV